MLHEDNASLQQLFRTLGQQSETRFTLVDADGKVLADSEQPTLAAVAAMDNHLDRQEFVRAKQGGAGGLASFEPDAPCDSPRLTDTSRG